MPRHFLVKRHKHCAGTFSYRDRLPECQDGADSSNYTTTTTIIDTDKHIIIRDGDYINDYGGYSSPDSGYAASPNSSHICYAREKDSLVTDLENNNNKALTKTTSAVSYYINNQCNMITINGNSLQHEEAIDTPMDLSMHSRKKQTPSSIAVYMEQEDSYKLHHSYHHQQQQQQQQLYYSTPPSQSIAALSTNAAVIRLDSFNKLYLNANTDRSLCAMMSPLSPTRLPYNPGSPYLSGADARAASLCPEAINPDVLLEAQTAAHAENLSRAHCKTVPSLIDSQKPLLQSPLLSPSPATLEPAATNDRATPLKTPSPLNSPSRKRAIIEDNDDVSSDLYPQDLSKSLPALKQNDLFNESNPTPVGQKSSSHKARTTAPVLKKSPASMATGKRLKAVRRLNFDIDTTSPVSGTIIKDAADFHPEDGKVVYGDIEPSFNFVEATPEARAELEKIENKIGDYICQLCKEFYEDAFQLAQHRCSRIVHVEYRCPECDKVFNCPANLASHRRWHKPRVNGQNKVISNGSGKNIPTSQKIAPKPDCNSNHVTDTVPGTPFKTVHSPNSFLGGMKNGVSLTTTEQGVEKDNDRTDSILYNRLSLEIVDCNRKQAIPLTKVEDVSMLPISHSNSESKENGYSVMVSGSQSLLSPSDQDQVKRPATPDNFLYTSAPDQDTCFRPDTVIAMNPLHITPETYGSSLTSEERSLVLQVLSCHNRQHQTTTINSTTTVMTPRTSDARSNYHVGVKPCSDNTATSEKNPSVCHDTVDSLNLTISSQLLSSPSLRDVRHTTDLLKHQQKQQIQTGLSEQQVNPQIGCSICGKKFQRQAYLRKHILSQHGKQNDVVKSGGIDNVKAGERDPVNTSHIDTDKTDERASSEGITKNISLTTSSQSSTDSTDDGGHMMKYRFGVAGQMLATESSKIKPEPTVHGLSTVLACSTCSITFASKAALDKHTRCAHASESFSCKYCTSTFHSSPGLTRHINKCHPTENRRVILLQLPATRTC